MFKSLLCRKYVSHSHIREKDKAHAPDSVRADREANVRWKSGCRTTHRWNHKHGLHEAQITHARRSKFYMLQQSLVFAHIHAAFDEHYEISSPCASKAKLTSGHGSGKGVKTSLTVHESVHLCVPLICELSNVKAKHEQRQRNARSSLKSQLDALQRSSPRCHIPSVIRMNSRNLPF